MSFFELVLIVFTGGGAGGVVFGLSRNTEYKLKVFGGKNWEIGFVGDILVGGVAALAAVAIVGPLLNLNLQSTLDATSLLKALAIAVIAGFSGISVLHGLRNTLSKRIDELSGEIRELKLEEKSDEFYEQGKLYLLHNDFESALIYYDHALQINPNNHRAKIGKAAVLKRTDKLEEAWNIVNQTAEEAPTMQAAWFNKACYGALLNHPEQQILADLEKAISLFPGYRSIARKDPDLESLWESPKFKAITKP